jgi:hypothetical protein
MQHGNMNVRFQRHAAWVQPEHKLHWKESALPRLLWFGYKTEIFS